MAKNTSLGSARRAKNDEFYTQLSDIENELKHYWEHFKGKVVYCNCDDPRVSNFFHYFSHKFRELGLKKLITTCYKNQNPDLFSRHDVENAIMLEYDGFRDSENVPNPEDIGIKKLDGDGDFRSNECIEILQQADIVVTNPPFSLFREYVDQLLKHDKLFLIIGNKNAITYKEIFPLISDNRVWIGYTSMSKDLLFDVSSEVAKELVTTKKEGSGYRIVDGKVKGRSQAVWFTNLTHKKRNEQLDLFNRYWQPGPDGYVPNIERYPAYENYNAIEVSKTVEIPGDYDGIMGVPISFLDRYNPKQFEIIDINPHFFAVIEQGKPKPSQLKITGRKDPYARILLRNKQPEPIEG